MSSLAASTRNIEMVTSKWHRKKEILRYRLNRYDVDRLWNGNRFSIRFSNVNDMLILNWKFYSQQTYILSWADRIWINIDNTLVPPEISSTTHPSRTKVKMQNFPFSLCHPNVRFIFLSPFLFNREKFVRSIWTHSDSSRCHSIVRLCERKCMRNRLYVSV